MKRSLLNKLVILLLVLPALACGLVGGEDPTATPEPEIEIEPSATPAPTETAPPPATPTEEPSPTPDVTADFATFESEELGLSVQHPADWVVQDLFVLIMATDEELLNTPDFIREGAIVAFLPDTTESLGSSDPLELMDDAVADIDMSDEVSIVGSPMATTIQGQDAAVARIEGTPEETGVDIVGQVVIIVNGGRAVVGIGLTPQESEEEYLPTIEAIMNSVVVSEPVEVEPTFEPEVDPGNPTAEDSTPLAVGEQAAETLLANDPQDFVFTGQAGTPVTIRVEPQDDNLDLVFEIFDTEINSLERVDEGVSGEPEETTFTPPADGDYFIRVEEYFGESGGFELSISAAGEETPTEQIRLEPGQFISGTIETGPAEYVIAGTAGQPATIFMIPEENLDATLALLDVNGAVLVEEVDDGFSGEAEAISYTPEADGDFVVEADAFGAGEGSFRIFLVDPAAAVTTEGTIAEDGEASFRVCVPANTTLFVFADPGDNLDLVANIHGGGGGTLIEETDNGFSGEPEVVILDGSDFNEQFPAVIILSGFAGQGGSFSLIVTSSSAEPVVLDGC